MTHCDHFYPRSQASGLSSDLICLTCGIPWSDEAVTAKRTGRPTATPNCEMCGPVTVATTEISTTHGKAGAFYTFDCPGCCNTIYRNLDATTAHILEVHGATNPPPLTDRDLRRFQLWVHTVRDIAGRAEWENR